MNQERKCAICGKPAHFRTFYCREHIKTEAPDNPEDLAAAEQIYDAFETRDVLYTVVCREREQFCMIVNTLHAAHLVQDMLNRREALNWDLHTTRRDEVEGFADLHRKNHPSAYRG